MAEELKELCVREGFSYVEGGSVLQRAARREPIRWASDWHFNVRGNEAVADALEKPLLRNLRERRGP